MVITIWSFALGALDELFEGLKLVNNSFHFQTPSASDGWVFSVNLLAPRTPFTNLIRYYSPDIEMKKSSI